MEAQGRSVLPEKERMGGGRGMPGNDKAFQEEGPARVRTGRRERAWNVWRVPSARLHSGCEGEGAGSPGWGAPGGWLCQTPSEGQCVPGQRAQTQLQWGILPEGAHLLMETQPAPWAGLRPCPLERAGRGGVITWGTRRHQAGLPPRTGGAHCAAFTASSSRSSQDEP